MTSPTLARPLAKRLIPIRQDALRVPLQLVLGVALMALLAQIEFNIGPIPITGQTFGVLLIGAAYGLSMGSLTMVLYLIVGGFGLGVFSGSGAGWAHFTGATAGYLFGFPFAAALVGFLAQRGWDRRFATTALAMLLGNLVIYIPGLLWLSQLMPDAQATLQAGLVPFIPGDVLKLLLASSLLPTAWHLLGRTGKHTDKRG